MLFALVSRLEDRSEHLLHRVAELHAEATQGVALALPRVVFGSSPAHAPKYLVTRPLRATRGHKKFLLNELRFKYTGYYKGYAPKNQMEERY